MDLPAFPATRWSLIARLPGQPQQAAALLALYADAVGGYLAAKLAGERRERVEDVVQEVLLDLLAKPELLARAAPGPGSRFRHYLMSLAWGAARNALRRARRRDLPSLDAADDGEEPMVERLSGDLAAADQQAAMDRAWARSLVQQALEELRRWSADGSLEPEAYAVLHANLVAGEPLRAVAARLGLSLATCSRRLARARGLLQQALVERLRLAGELGADEDPAAACSILLAALADPA